jgi:hypothetical protein
MTTHSFRFRVQVNFHPMDDVIPNQERIEGSILSTDDRVVGLRRAANGEQVLEVLTDNAASILSALEDDGFEYLECKVVRIRL